MIVNAVGERIWPTRYFDSRLGREVVKIKPGEFFATTQPFVIATVLGSCVSACIRDLARGSAGMNHFMLPAEDEHAVPGEHSLCYGVYAMESLINEFVKHGSLRRDLEAKVFGGSSVMTSGHGDIGRLNSEFVVGYLGTEGIATTAVDLGGPYPRKVLMFADTGDVWVKYLSRLTNDTIETRETEYARELTTFDFEPGVELF